MERLSRGMERGERLASGFATTLRRPAVYAALVAATILLGVGLRLALVPGANDVFAGHADSKQYFVKAYGENVHGFYYPLAHGGSGWPLLLAAAMKTFGFEGTAGFSMHMDAPFDEEGAHAILFAYAFHAMVAAGLVVATFLLARLMVGPLAAVTAALLVAIDPFLLGQSTTVMADQLFAVLVILALACVLQARRHPAWLLAAGGLIALSHTARVNGLLFLGTTTLFAWFVLRADVPRHKAWHLALPAAAFALVALPYLLWRAEHLPHAFDYGTNQRFWTDDPWNFGDAYWASYSYAGGGVRETAADYFATHTWGEALARLYHSGQWQLLDLTRVTLTPMLLLLGVAGMAATRREAWSPLAPLVGFTLAATFFWVYPVVRSPRYFLVLIPIFAILAAEGAARAAAVSGRASLAFAAIVGPYFVTYGVEPVVALPRALPLLRDPYVAPMVVTCLCAMVFVLLLACAWRDLRPLLRPRHALARGDPGS